MDAKVEIIRMIFMVLITGGDFFLFNNMESGVKAVFLHLVFFLME
jgi:hypothetical protein